jgi:TPR repeat protein
MTDTLLTIELHWRRGKHSPGRQTGRGSVMARWEMGGVEMASMAEAKPTPEDLFELGMSCSAGRDTDADLIAAHKWFNIAAIKGLPEAANYRQEVAREMTPAAIAVAQRAAREWLTAH